jgi:hypothetical protein
VHDIKCLPELLNCLRRKLLLEVGSNLWKAQLQRILDNKYELMQEIGNITINNVPVVYMAREVMTLMRAPSITRAIRDFFEPLKVLSSRN